jgi:DHA1 family multidrug resistance protein-like MFS transporter
MWSLVQYRRIGKQVENQWQKNRTGRNGNKHRRSEHDYEYRPLAVFRGRENGSSQLHSDSMALADARQPTPDRDTNSMIVVVEKVEEDDPIDPRNWTLLSRCKNVAILSLLIFVQGWAGSSDSMANSRAGQAFSVSKVAMNLSQAVYLFGIGTGVLFCGPLSETIGRNPTYLTSTFFYLCSVLASALTTSFGGRIVCRYFVGLFVSATLGINGASVGDQWCQCG